MPDSTKKVISPLGDVPRSKEHRHLLWWLLVLQIFLVHFMVLWKDQVFLAHWSQVAA